MELYLSLSAYGGVSTRKALSVFWEAGVRHIELAIGPKPDIDTVQAIQDFKQQGMIYRAHHAFVWDNRHYPFSLAQPQKWDYFQRLVDWLADNSITAYSVHGGNFSERTERAAAYAIFIENINYLNQLCQARGIVLGVETMYPTVPGSGFENLLDNNEEVEQFCKDAPQIKIVVDMAHLNIWRHYSDKEKLQWLKLPPERILEIHISDNDGLHDTHTRITQNTWWISEVAQFPKVVPIVLESRLNRLPVSIVQQEYDRIVTLIS
ncbi:hypothetical protein DSM106972_079620 [Dulcicalothrix desertica PCC 7102]|uniref:Xylose isomerase-like TIM barrel domain-containing protein n=1 Tax=Dulcicalothrix desertica PCC 7102 TaxID=232991 RepID=A0A3S1ASR7_9CYAN|nr:TIM barrel protein [Dulcicalothrix desertica]RUS98576.1 hypothetical protein DSM106972_079620 [Dulcicalothrix desertica PCC 7102]TWH43083.1 sugar phosphate isomerase/epimerase [Dulcicalothrix desertica PCC 7102]